MSQVDFECFFEGMHRCLVFIRSNIKEPFAPAFIKIVDDYANRIINNTESYYTAFRDEILYIIPESEKKHDLMQSLSIQCQPPKLYSQDVIKFLPFLSEVLNLARKELNVSNYQDAYHLVDSIHFLPQVLLNFETWNKKKYWKTYVIQNGYKWSDDFLRRWVRQFKPNPLLEKIMIALKK